MRAVVLDSDVAGLVAGGGAAYERMTVAEARRAYDAGRRASSVASPGGAWAEALELPGPGGRLAARLYRPSGGPAGALPVLLFLHGGGWVLGDLDSHDGLCRRLAALSGCAVLALDYRLAPESPFPAAIEDALAAFAWLREAAGGLGLDPARIAIGGDSAGGNLAAVACLLLRERGGAMPLFQLLLYPVTDLRRGSPSQAALADGHLLTGPLQNWFRRLYLGEAGSPEDWRASPVLAPGLSGLPPAYVLTASHDPLRDEGEAYARRLVEAGVPVTQWRVPGQIHGFLPMDRVIAFARPATARVAAYLRFALTSQPGE